MATIVKFYKDGRNVKDITSIGYLPVDEDAVKDSRHLASSGSVIAAAALGEESMMANLPIADNTLRFSFGKLDYDPTEHWNGRAGTWTKKNTKFTNVWDWTRNDPDWSFSFNEAFNNDNNLVKIIGAGDTSSVTNLSQMFRVCASITELCLFDTSNVSSFYIFISRAKISKIPSYDTKNVTNFNYAFFSLKNLKTIPLLNTEKAKTVSYMFSDCFNVESGALAIYTQLSTQTNPPSIHLETFTNCGKGTEEGRAALAQIPVSWGGTMEEEP